MMNYILYGYPKYVPPTTASVVVIAAGKLKRMQHRALVVRDQYITIILKEDQLWQETEFPDRIAELNADWHA